MADIVESLTAPDCSIISVVDLRRRLSGKDGGPAQWEKWLKTASNACSKLVAYEATPGFINSAAKGFISRTVHPPLP